MASIYRAFNTINEKVYVGFDKNWPKRKADHFYEAFNPKSRHYRSRFHSAIRKYGWDSFVWDVLYESDNAEHTLHVMEGFYIEKNNSHHLDGHGYNMTYGGEGQLGLRQTEHQKKTASLTHKGRKHTPESVEKRAVQRRKTYLLENIHTGQSQNVVGIGKFCRENNLDRAALYRTHKGESQYHHGWVIREISNG